MKKLVIIVIVLLLTGCAGALPRPSDKIIKMGGYEIINYTPTSDKAFAWTDVYYTNDYTVSNGFVNFVDRNGVEHSVNGNVRISSMNKYKVKIIKKKK